MALQMDIRSMSLQLHSLEKLLEQALQEESWETSQLSIDIRQRPGYWSWLCVATYGHIDLEDLVDHRTSANSFLWQYKRLRHAWGNSGSYLVQLRLTSYIFGSRPDVSQLAGGKGGGVPDLAGKKKSNIAIHNITERYTWLDNNITYPLLALLHQLQIEDLFVNVKDPATNAWQWDTANWLVFEMQDVKDVVQYMQHYILFERLLQVTGVLRVFHPQYPMGAVNAPILIGCEIHQTTCPFHHPIKSTLLFPQSRIPVVIAYAPATLTFHYVAQETWVIIQQDNFESIQVGSLLEISLAYPHSKEHPSTWTRFIVFEVTTDSTFTGQNI
ncbi:hypothetical protein B0H34DRAFT_677660 [Crassisporium funariophilum]|nr:hypothetical protein B0H34DRAFT_677660 [Crassisporium funariophilum]